MSSNRRNPHFPPVSPGKASTSQFPSALIPQAKILRPKPQLSKPLPTSSNKERKKEKRRIKSHSPPFPNKPQDTHSPPIPQTLRPTQQTQQPKTLRLHLNRDIELLRYRIRPEGNPTQRPQEHHGRGKTFGRFGAVVAHDLRD